MVQGHLSGTSSAFYASSSMLMYFYQLLITTAHNSLGPSPCANISIEVVGFADGTYRVAGSTLIRLCCGTHVG
jgi:hypothetical protein